MPPTKEVVSWWRYLAESKIYMTLPPSHPERKRWLRSTSESELPKARGKARTKEQIRTKLQREVFGGRFKCHSCDLRFKTRKARRHHEKYSHKHVGRVRAPLILFMDIQAEDVPQAPFNPPRKRHPNTRSTS